jgi:hypothetical protein
LLRRPGEVDSIQKIYRPPAGRGGVEEVKDDKENGEAPKQKPTNGTRGAGER